MSFRIILITLFMGLLGPSWGANFMIPDGDVEMLRLSIDISNVNGEADTIHLATNGMYEFFSFYVSLSGQEVTEIALPELKADPGVSSGPHLVIYGNGATFRRSLDENTPIFRAFYINAGINLKVEDLTFTNFQITTDNFDGSCASNRDGAVILAEDVERLVFTRCIFRDNMHFSCTSNQNSGGGALTIFRAQAFILENCQFIDNQANYGGAIYMTRSNTLITGCTFSGNANPSMPLGREGGGAIRFDLGSQENDLDFYIFSTLFENNTTYQAGGAIVGDLGRDGQSLNIEDCIFRGNRSLDTGGSNAGQGGAIDVNANSLAQVILKNSVFYNNLAEKKGGALHLDGTSINIENTTFAFNQAVDSSGILGTGGAIHCSEGNFNITHATLAYNHAGDQGGGIFATPSSRLTSTLLAFNTANNEEGIKQNAAREDFLTQEDSTYFQDGGNNLEFPDVQTSPQDGYATISSSFFVRDPLLSENLTYFCGEMPVLALAPSSPAVDAADSTISKDQLGNPRGMLSDIGAYEYQGPSLLPFVSISQENIPVRDPNFNPLIRFVANPEVLSGTPSFRWFVKGVEQEATGLTFSARDLKEGDSLYIIMTPQSTPDCQLPSTVTSPLYLVQYENAPKIEIGEILADDFLPDTESSLDIFAELEIAETRYIKEIQLQHRAISEDNWETVSLGRDFPNKRVASTLQESWFGPIGLEIRLIGININDISDTSAIAYAYRSYTNDGIVLTDAGRYSIAYGDEEDNYRMVSVPLDLSNPSISSVFEDDLETYKKRKFRRNWRLFQYENGANREYTDGLGSEQVLPGKSYWMIVKKEKHLESGQLDTGPGTTVQVTKNSLYTLDLKVGYNQIASPYPFDVDWNAVKEANSGIQLPDNLQAYEGAWANTQELPAYKGAFVEVPSNITIQIPVEAAGKKRRAYQPLRNSIDQSTWEVLLDVKNNKTAYYLGAIGMNEEALAGKDIFDIKTPPRFGKFIELVHKDSPGEKLRLTKDVVVPAKEHVWEFSVNTSEKDELTTLTWENDYFGNSGMQLWLFDVERQKLIDMALTKQHAFFTTKESYDFRIYYGSRDRLLSLLEPDNSSLDIPHPHPITGTSILPFTLAGSQDISEVELILFDLMGRKMSSIYQDKLEPGFHEVSWDPTSTRIPAGTYIIYLWVNQEPKSYQKIIIR